jgi:ribonuclease HI
MACQLSGVYKVKSANLKPLYDETINLLRCFRQVRISHVMREFNKRADELANAGIKKQRKAAKRKPPRQPTRPKHSTELVQRELEL